jgi:two-component system sensor histidine kinase MprB
MTLRRRLALLSALAVALAVVIASAVIYALVRDELRGDVDEELGRQASRATQRFDRVVAGPAGSLHVAGEGVGGTVEHAPMLAPAPPPGEEPPLGQLIDAGGAVVPTAGTPIRIPVSDADRALAATGGEPRFADVDAGDSSLRVLTQPLGDGRALQLAASLDDTEETLSTLVLILFLVSAGGVALAAALGPVVARTALAPAAEVSGAAEEVARTQDLARRIDVRGDDELGRLAASFNEMMAALERSQGAQRRLVADASHELRTPLATLRLNIEALGRGEGLDPDERGRLVADLTDELEELTALVADVVELARDPGSDGLVVQDVRLDELGREALQRARRRARGLSFGERLSPALARGDPERLGRAISNLLDNAAKWSPVGGEVELTVAPGRVAVRDHGPGFSDEDLPRVFDRFWRSDEARGTQGSGLGLAIVQRVAEEHGGRARAANAPGGGALVEIELPREPQGGS